MKWQEHILDVTVFIKERCGDLHYAEISIADNGWYNVYIFDGVLGTQFNHHLDIYILKDGAKCELCVKRTFLEAVNQIRKYYLLDEVDDATILPPHDFHEVIKGDGDMFITEWFIS